MPAKLTTTLSKIPQVPNKINSAIKEFHTYMKAKDSSERHQNNNLKVVIAYANFLGSDTTFFEVQQKARLTAVSDAAWAMAARAREEGNDKLEADALRLAKDTVKQIRDIVTDNKPLIGAAYEVAYNHGDEEQPRQINNLKVSQEKDNEREPIV